MEYISSNIYSKGGDISITIWGMWAERRLQKDENRILERGKFIQH